ncbi:hypothetical protein [Bosea sp. Root483D1]|nr:hypothetical protein [Bosea sp. Root483D1]
MILVCGEALVDLFLDPPDDTETAGRADAGPMPKAVEVERELARSG